MAPMRCAVVGLIAFAMPACVHAAPVPIHVAIDVGHFLAKPGATSARGRPEFEFNRALAAEIAAAVRPSSRLVGGDGDMTVLSRRVQAARGADLLVSIHHDSVQPQFLEKWEYEGTPRLFSDRYAGFSLFVSRKNADVRRSLACASAIGASLRAAGFTPSLYHAQPIAGEMKPFADRANGVHYYDNLVVLKGPLPAVLFEAGVIVNRAEERALSDPAARTRMARAVAAGIETCIVESAHARL
jgi:N-acetylmuramoyl-L-alanine amidase